MFTKRKKIVLLGFLTILIICLLIADVKWQNIKTIFHELRAENLHLLDVKKRFSLLHNASHLEFKNMQNMRDEKVKLEKYKRPNERRKARFGSVFKTRSEHVKQTCKRYGSDSNKSIPEYILRRILVSDQHKILFCLIPKVSATTWRRIFLEMAGNVPQKKIKQLSNQAVFYKMYNKYRTLKNYNVTEINYRLNFYTKAMFVRNPYERLLSAYRNKFVENNEFDRQYKNKIITKFRNNKDLKSRKLGVTFLEFIKFVTQRVGTQNLHWTSFWNLCMPCVIDYDYIGKFENLSNEAENLLHIIGSNVHFPSRNTFYNATETKQVLQKYYSKIPKKYIYRITKQYKKDFELFSYEAKINEKRK